MEASRSCASIVHFCRNGLVSISELKKRGKSRNLSRGEGMDWGQQTSSCVLVEILLPRGSVTQIWRKLLQDGGVGIVAE